MRLRFALLDFRRQFQRLPVPSERSGALAHFEEMSEVLPLGGGGAAGAVGAASVARIQVDVIADLSCPIAYLALTRLRHAIDGLVLGSVVELRRA